MQSTPNPTLNKTKLLLTYFQENGLLLCNESRELPYLELAGGDWNAIVSLIEDGQVFYSKLFERRVTYLSRVFYANIKPYKQRLGTLSETAQTIFGFLSDVGRANTAEIKGYLALPSKVFTQGMNELSGELLVTALERDRTMNASWSSFYWGTFKAWESLHPIADIETSADALKRLTQNILGEKKLAQLMR